MKKWVKILIVVVSLILVFVLGYYAGVGTGVNVTVEGSLPGILSPSAGSATVQTTAPAQSGTAATTQAPAQNDTPAASDATTAPSADNNTPDAPAATGDSSTEEIVSKVTEAMNKLKSEKNFTGKKTEKTVINIKECSASALTNPLNSICQKVAGEKLSTYDFKDGSAVGIGDDGTERNDGKALSPKEALPPKGEDFVLTAAGVKEATETKSGDSTTYTIKLVSETSTVDSAPAVNKAAIGYLNLGGFSIPTVSITQADINYPESVITVTVDGQGRVTSLKIDQPMDGTMGAKIAIVSGDILFDGGQYETWEITY